LRTAETVIRNFVCQLDLHESKAERDVLTINAKTLEVLHSSYAIMVRFWRPYRRSTRHWSEISSGSRGRTPNSRNRRPLRRPVSGQASPAVRTRVSNQCAPLRLKRAREGTNKPFAASNREIMRLNCAARAA